MGMTWLDAAEEVLRENAYPTHYRDVGEAIIERGLVDTRSQTPSITLHASVALDQKKRITQGLPGRILIQRGGILALAEWEADPFGEAKDQARSTRVSATDQLLARLRELSGEDFESFLEVLFSTMGYNVTVTGGSDDQGVDLVAELSAVGLGAQRVGIQAKAKGEKREIGPTVVRQLRDALSAYGCNAGAVVATTSFNADAVAVAQEPGKPPVQLVGAEELAELALESRVGIRSESVEWFREELDAVFDPQDAEADSS
ncbi:MAG: restriction endonuclease [Actinomycetota bacterium]